MGMSSLLLGDPINGDFLFGSLENHTTKRGSMGTLMDD